MIASQTAYRHKDYYQSAGSNIMKRLGSFMVFGPYLYAVEVDDPSLQSITKSTMESITKSTMKLVESLYHIELFCHRDNAYLIFDCQLNDTDEVEIYRSERVWRHEHALDYDQVGLWTGMTKSKRRIGPLILKRS